MNNAQWWAHRGQMRGYMPAMVKIRRRHEGRRRHLENIGIAIFWIVYAIGGFWVQGYAASQLGLNPFIIFVIVLGLGLWITNRFFRAITYEDVGLHNLKGYDPATGTVPELEAQGINTRALWPNNEKRTYDSEAVRRATNDPHGLPHLSPKRWR